MDHILTYNFKRFKQQVLGGLWVDLQSMTSETVNTKEAGDFIEALTGDFTANFKDELPISATFQSILKESFCGYLAKCVQFQFKVIFLNLENQDNSLCICGTDENRMDWLQKHLHIDELIADTKPKPDTKKVGDIFQERFLINIDGFFGDCFFAYNPNNLLNIKICFFLTNFRIAAKCRFCGNNRYYTSHSEKLRPVRPL